MDEDNNNNNYNEEELPLNPSSLSNGSSLSVSSLDLLDQLQHYLMMVPDVALINNTSGQVKDTRKLLIQLN